METIAWVLTIYLLICVPVAFYFIYRKINKLNGQVNECSFKVNFQIEREMRGIAVKHFWDKMESKDNPNIHIQALEANIASLKDEIKTYQDLTKKLKEENDLLRQENIDLNKKIIWLREKREKAFKSIKGGIYKTGYYEFNLDLQNNKFLFGIEQKPVNGIARFKDGEIYFSDFEQ